MPTVKKATSGVKPSVKKPSTSEKNVKSAVTEKSVEERTTEIKSAVFRSIQCYRDAERVETVSKDPNCTFTLFAGSDVEAIKRNTNSALSAAGNLLSVFEYSQDEDVIELYKTIGSIFGEAAMKIMSFADTRAKSGRADVIKLIKNDEDKLILLNMLLEYVRKANCRCAKEECKEVEQQEDISDEDEQFKQFAREIAEAINGMIAR